MMEYSFVGGWHQCVSVWSKLHVALYMLFVASLLSWQTVYVMYICFQTALRCYPIFVLITFNTYKYVRGKNLSIKFWFAFGKKQYCQMLAFILVCVWVNVCMTSAEYVDMMSAKAFVHIQACICGCISVCAKTRSHEKAKIMIFACRCIISVELFGLKFMPTKQTNKWMWAGKKDERTTGKVHLFEWLVILSNKT